MPDFISVDLRQVKRFARELERASEKAVPYAIRDYVNSAAFEAQREWKDVIGQRLTLRNNWTTRSIQVRKASGLKPKEMSSQVGSIADYMDEQEEGTTTAKSGKHGVALPTAGSAGQGKAKKRTRPIRRGNYLSALHVPDGRVTGSRQRRNRVAMIRAIKTGTRVAYLDLGKGRGGLFKINGSVERLRKPVMLYDLSRKATKTPASHTLQGALDAIQPRLPSIAVRAIMGQMNRALARAK